MNMDEVTIKKSENPKEIAAATMRTYRANKGAEIYAPQDFRWPGGKRIAAHFRVAFEGWSDGEAPGLGVMGNPLKPGYLDLNFIEWAEYGPRRGIYRLLNIFEKYEVKVTITINGILCERYPNAVKAVADAGHEVVGHSYAMDLMHAYLTEEQERENILRTTEALEKLTGIRPKGWASPRGTPSIHTIRLLMDEGYEWCGDSLNDDMPYVIEAHGRSIVRYCAGMEINDLPTTVKHGFPPRVVLEIFEDTLAALRRDKGPQRLDATAHAHVSGRPHASWVYERMLDIATNSDDLWIGTRLEAVRHFKKVLGMK